MKESIYKIGKKLGNIEFQNQTFHQHKEPISIKNIDINKIVVSYRVSFGKKGFKNIRLL